MAAAVVDTGGHLVYFEKMDHTQTGSVAVAIDKARSAALFKRPTKSFQDTLAAGGEGLRVLRIQGAIAVKKAAYRSPSPAQIVGAIGLSGRDERSGWGMCASRVQILRSSGSAAISSTAQEPTVHLSTVLIHGINRFPEVRPDGHSVPLSLTPG